MKKYHTGYYLTFRGKEFTPEEYSEELINDPRMQLVVSNYIGKDWHIEWVFNKNLNGLEFIINTNSFDIAQNVLFNVLCSSAVINGTVTWSNDAHYPHEFGTIGKLNKIRFNPETVKAYSDFSIPSYFYLAVLASKDYDLANSIIKYQLSTEIYSKNYMELNQIIDWKTTNYNYIQMRFAYAIILAYSVIEELGLNVNVNVSKIKRSILEDGNWNKEVLDDLLIRLTSANINIQEDISWMIRGVETEIEKKRPIKTTRDAEWADSPDYEDDFSIKVNDGYVYLPDAINYISFLRSSIASHSVGTRIMNLSVYDVANAQFLARRLILEKIGLWE